MRIKPIRFTFASGRKHQCHSKDWLWLIYWTISLSFIVCFCSADEASNALFGLSPKRENSPPDVKFRGSAGRGRGARSSSRRGRVGGRRSNSDQSDDDDRSSQVSSSSRARNGNVKSSSPRNAGFSGEDYLSLRKSSSSAKKGKKGAQSGWVLFFHIFIGLYSWNNT